MEIDTDFNYQNVLRDSSATLGSKRPMSPGRNDDDDAGQRKRFKDSSSTSSEVGASISSVTIDGEALADDLAQELQCPCCSDLVYKPVTILPCDHITCGSCLTLWIKNGGTACPACRSISTAVVPSRAIQTMVNVLLRAAPHRQRTERERMQADEIYPLLRTFRIPPPREPSPEPTIPPPTDFHQPCPMCSPNNAYNWSCPRPIPNPATDPGTALRKEAGLPEGHGTCGNCESLLALRAPLTSRCDFCQAKFCGISIQGRCVAVDILSQSPQGFADTGDMIQSGDVYDVLDANATEVDAMIEYMTSQRILPRQVYRQIAAHIQNQPDGFQNLLDEGIFSDEHAASSGNEPTSSTPPKCICRVCATDVFLFGLRDWWIRERKKAIESDLLPKKPDCVLGRDCEELNDAAHARKFNHLIEPQDPPIARANPEAIMSPVQANPSGNGFAVTSFLSLSGLPRLADLDNPLPSFSATSYPSYLAPNELSMASRFSTPAEANGSVSESWTEDARRNTSLAARIADLLNPREIPAAQATGSGSAVSRTFRGLDESLDFGRREPHSDESHESVEAFLVPETPNLARRDTGKAPARGGDAEDEDRRLESYYNTANFVTAGQPSSSGVGVLERARSPLKTLETDDQRVTRSRSPHRAPSTTLRFLSPLLGSSTGGNSVDPVSSAYPLQVE